ncbi:MAG: hypothetical protein ACRD2C_20615 [Acidimicrobiales bacterium]
MTVMKKAGAAYIAVPSWDGQQWQVRVQDWNDQHRGDTSAPRLDQVAPNAALLLGARFGCDPDLLAVSVEPELPKEIEHAFEVAEAYFAQGANDVEAAITALRQIDVCGHDIAAIVGERDLSGGPRRPLLIPNSEIATHGLADRPNVVAVQWLDRHVVLTCCRACVDNKARPWQINPQGTSAAVYEPGGRCDLCDTNLRHAGEAGQ